MSYRFDGDELFSLAGWVSRVSADLDDIAREVSQVLARVHRSSGSVRALGPVVVACADRAEDLGRRAVFLSEANANVWAVAWDRRSELAELWREIETFDGSDNDPRLDAMLGQSVASERAWLTSLGGLSPAEVAALAAALPTEIGRRLAWTDPGAVASTDGLPLAWRALATRRLMGIEADRLRSELATESGDRSSERLRRLEGWIGSERTFVWFDPSGDGQLIEVVGEVEAATGIGVFVPGIGSDLETFEAVASHARALVSVARTMGHDIAVVAWLGYDAPAVGWNVEPLLGDQAEAGSPNLVAFVDGLSAQRPHVPMTVVAHSYGSVVAAWAAAHDHLSADRLVIVGSPNVVVDHASGLILPDSAAVFVGEAPSDPVVAIGDLTDGWRDDWSGLGHGYDPGACDWGAKVFEVQDVGLIDAHVTYTSGASAETIVNIMVGDPENVPDRCG